MPIRAVILDIGGVLEANPSTGWQERWAGQVGLGSAELVRRLGPSYHAGSIGTMSLEQVHRQIGAELGLDASGVRKLMEDVWLEYVGRLDHELAGWFAGLRPRYRTGLLSNSFVGAREREQAAHGLQDLCDAIVYSHEVGLRKPDPRIYALACDRLGVRPETAVFVDDVAVNVEGARQAGMLAVEHRGAPETIAAVQALL